MSASCKVPSSQQNATLRSPKLPLTWKSLSRESFEAPMTFLSASGWPWCNVFPHHWSRDLSLGFLWQEVTRKRTKCSQKRRKRRKHFPSQVFQLKARKWTSRWPYRRTCPRIECSPFVTSPVAVPISTRSRACMGKSHPLPAPSRSSKLQKFRNPLSLPTVRKASAPRSLVFLIPKPKAINLYKAQKMIIKQFLTTFPPIFDAT